MEEEGAALKCCFSILPFALVLIIVSKTSLNKLGSFGDGSTFLEA
jgi:hypothetical protein